MIKLEVAMIDKINTYSLQQRYYEWLSGHHCWDHDTFEQTVIDLHEECFIDFISEYDEMDEYEMDEYEMKSARSRFVDCYIENDMHLYETDDDRRYEFSRWIELQHGTFTVDDVAEVAKMSDKQVIRRLRKLDIKKPNGKFSKWEFTRTEYDKVMDLIMEG